MPELVALRGLLKRRFPNPKAGTLDVNVLQAVDKFMNGINYSATKDEYEKDYGVINTVIGTVCILFYVFLLQLHFYTHI